MKNTEVLRGVENIKVVIFDFDDTLYRGNCGSGWAEHVKKFMIYCFNDEERANRVFNKYRITDQSNGSEVAQAMINELGSAKKFVRYEAKNIYIIDYSKIKNITSEELARVANKLHLYIVSNSTIKYVKYHMKKMGINRKYFKKIYQNNFLKSDMSKAVAYKKILKKEKVKPTQIVVIGDNYHNDIQPALDLGMQGVCVGGLEDVRTVLGNLI